MKSDVYDVAILGSGISGLTLAHKLKGAIRVGLFEKCTRAGGLIRTEHGNEWGPQSIRTRGSGLHALELALSLRLEKEIIFPQATKRYVQQAGRLEELPSSLRGLLTSPLFKGLLPSIFKEPFTAKSQIEDESIGAFFERRFGPKIVNALIDPFITGIYAGDASQLSLRSCFPDLYRKRSVMLGMLFGKKEKTPYKAPFFSFREGMETLTAALQKSVQDSLFLEEEAVGIEYDKGWNVYFKSGRAVRAGKLVSALPLHALKELVPETPEIPESSLAVVTIGCSSNKEGFGYLVPSSENSPLLGVIFSSSIFPEQGRPRITAMLGGARNPGLVDLSDAEILATALQEISKTLGPITPVYSYVHRIRSAIPQYPVGYWKRLEQFSKIMGVKAPNFFWTGSGFAGVSVGDLVKSAKNLAPQILNCQ